MNTNYSVLMSVYKKENPSFLKESLDSILSQTVPAQEIIVVCDGPLTKELDQVLEDYTARDTRLRLVRLEKNVGLGLALNQGLNECRNDIVARMDSDDICKPNRMELELVAMEEQQADIVSGALVEFSESIHNLGAVRQVPESNEAIIRFARRRNPFNHPTVLYRKSKVQAAGGYQDFPLFEDYYLWLRMLKQGFKGYNVQETVLYMRTGAGMYQRRGGLGYVGKILRFRWYMVTHGHCGLGDFAVTAIGHSLVALVPNGLRQKFYEKVLRK